MTRGWSLVILLLAVAVFQLAESRQMCLSCQFLRTHAGAQGEECNNDPWKWAQYGNPRMRCPFICTFEVRKDTARDLITYSYRGCSASNDVPPSECFEDEANNQVRCYFTCEGTDYCNNWNATDLLTSSAPALSHVRTSFTVVFVLSVMIKSVLDRLTL